MERGGGEVEGREEGVVGMIEGGVGGGREGIGGLGSEGR